jgi:hypothetical protein
MMGISERAIRFGLFNVDHSPPKFGRKTGSYGRVNRESPQFTLTERSSLAGDHLPKPSSSASRGTVKLADLLVHVLQRMGREQVGVPLELITQPAGVFGSDLLQMSLFLQRASSYDELAHRSRQPNSHCGKSEPTRGDRRYRHRLRFG